MTNIEKLYELAVKSKKLNWDTMEFELPPFTESKQLELIKLLSCSNDFFLDINGEKPKFTDINGEKPKFTDVFLWTISVEWYTNSKYYKNIQKDFSQALAGLVCKLWEELTDEQREEVRGILQ